MTTLKIGKGNYITNFQKKKIGKGNVVQVVTNTQVRVKKLGDMLKGVFWHIFQTPCATQYINLMFGGICKATAYSTSEQVVLVFFFNLQFNILYVQTTTSYFEQFC